MEFPPLATPDEQDEHLQSATGGFDASLAAESLQGYLDRVVIDGSAGPAVFGEVAETWQRRSLWPIMAAIEGVARINPDYQGPHCFWRDLPQGHDKTSGIARILNGALAFGRKPLRVGVFARDTDQANRIHSFMKDEAKLNPWLAERITYVQGKARGVNGSELTIYDADYEGNAGHKLDVCVVEEVTWWMAKARALYEQLYSRRTKIQGSVFVVLGNAGIKRTWQHKKMLEAREDPDWDYYRTDGSVAGWIDGKKLARDMRTVAPSIARRVYGNEWIDEDEQVYIRRDEVDACLAVAAGMGLARVERRQAGVKYAAAIDYGPKKNTTAMGVVGLHKDDTRRLARLDVLQGKHFPGGVVPMQEVRAWARNVHQAFHPVWIVDPYQMEWFIQEVEGVWEVHRMEYRGGKTNYAMAEHFRHLIVQKQFLWPEAEGVYDVVGDDGELRPWTLGDEIADLVTKDMPYGYRWDHKSGHTDDRATVCGMATYILSKVDVSRPFDKRGQIPSLDMNRDPARLLQPQEGFTMWGPGDDK